MDLHLDLDSVFMYKKNKNIEFDETYYLRTLLIRIYKVLTTSKHNLELLIKEIEEEISEQERR